MNTEMGAATGIGATESETMIEVHITLTKSCNVPQNY